MTLREFYDEVRTWEVVNGFYRIQDSIPFRNHIQNCMNLNLMEFRFSGNIALCKILKEYDESYEKTNTIVRGYIKVKRSNISQETIDKAVELFKLGYSKKEIGNMLNITHVFLTKILESNFTAEEIKKHKLEQVSKTIKIRKGGIEMTDKERLIERYGQEKIDEIIRRFKNGEARHFITQLLNVSYHNCNKIVPKLFTLEEIAENKAYTIENRGMAISLTKQKIREEKAKMVDINKHDIEIENDKCFKCQDILNKKDETIIDLREKLMQFTPVGLLPNIPENVVKFQEITKRMAELYALKNKKYGNSFSKTFKEYGKPVVCLRIDDKISRLKQMILKGESDTADESILDTLIDVANYSVMSIMELENVNQE